MAEHAETGVEEEIPSLTERLTEIGWGHRVKVACSACGQKLDMTEIAPFAAVCCPNCSARVVRPVYFGDYVLEDTGRRRDRLTTVFRAYDSKLGRYVSLKILNPEYSASAGARSRFTRIARLLAAVNHPAILSIYNCGELYGLAYIVSQYAEYGTLPEFLALQKEPLPTEMVLGWCCDLASGLQKASASGLSHGEIEPANLLVDSGQRIRLTGFGLAELMREAGFQGSRVYAAPEKIAEGTIHEKSDVYSLGVLLCRLLAGREPSGPGVGKRETPGILSKIGRRAGREVAELVGRMLSASPEERPDFPGILETLSPVLAGLEQERRTRKQKISSRLQYHGNGAGTSPGKNGIFSRERQRGRRFRLALLLAAVAVVAAAALLLLIRRG